MDIPRLKPCHNTIRVINRGKLTKKAKHTLWIITNLCDSFASPYFVLESVINGIVGRKKLIRAIAIMASSIPFGNVSLSSLINNISILSTQSRISNITVPVNSSIYFLLWEPGLASWFVANNNVNIMPLSAMLVFNVFGPKNVDSSSSNTKSLKQIPVLIDTNVAYKNQATGLIGRFPESDTVTLSTPQVCACFRYLYEK